MSAQLKTFFDRITDLLTIHKSLGRQLRSGKKMFSIACSSDSVAYEAFQLPFEKTAEYLGMTYGGHLHSWVEATGISEEVLAKIDVFCELVS